MSVSLASLMSARQERKRRTASYVLQVTADCCGCTGNHSHKTHQDCMLKLCIPHSVTTERPVQVKVVKVKKSDKGDFYKRQQTWELRDLTEVDAKDASKVRMTIGFFFFFWHSCWMLNCQLFIMSLSHYKGKSGIWPPLWEGVSVGSQQHRWKKLLHLLYLEA